MTVRNFGLRRQAERDAALETVSGCFTLQKRSRRRALPAQSKNKRPRQGMRQASLIGELVWIA